MTKSYAILPCNGLDKCAGCITKEVAVKLAENTESEIICPVLYRVADARYSKIAAEKPLLVLDGCATRCASKLASEKGLRISEKLNVTDEAKANNVKLGSSLKMGTAEEELVNNLVDKLSKEEEKAEISEAGMFPVDLEYETYQKDKFLFKVPKEGFYFNENDSWVYVVGNKARVGVTDYVQHSLSDIMFFTPPSVGNEVSQFDEVGTIESGKAVYEVISPVSGTITAVNDTLSQKPELINESPYEQG
ncbi:Glycine cleavage system H protein [bioreactor metagenome]|uniref:Glycine cleavage system H protein n=2 Tax=root TaxID=1 RepID=A0A644Z7Y1_9ZZZZ